MTIIYLIVGNGPARIRFQDELICSLFSLLHVASRKTKRLLEVIVFSDTTIRLPKALQDLRINIRPINALMADGRNKNYFQYPNGLKPVILKEALSTTDLPCAIVDTDTYFIKDPMSLFTSIGRGRTVMHVMEHPFTFRPALNAYLQAKGVERTDIINQYFVNSSLNMWNSGVVGLVRSDMYLLDEILSLQDYLLLDERYPEHERIFIEQTATCSILQANTRLSPSDSVVMHYWFAKPFVRVLQKFFGETYGQQFPFYAGSIDGNIGQENISGLTFEALPELMIRMADKHFSLKILAENISRESSTGSVLHQVMDELAENQVSDH